MFTISKNIEQLSSYNPGKTVKELIKEFNLKKTAVLWNNENNTGISSISKKFICENLKDINLYPNPNASELCKKIADKNNRNNNEVFVGNGSEEIISNIIKAFVSEKEEIITSEGTFVAIYIWAKLHNVNITKIPLTKNYSYNLDKIYNAINVRTKLIYISNPNNPTGTIIENEKLIEFINKVPKNIIIVLDEAYFEYTKKIKNDFLDSTTLHKNNIITLRSFSKAYGLAGLRVGYAIADSIIINILKKVKMIFSPSLLSQVGAIGALEDDIFLKNVVSLNKKALIRFYELFTKQKIKFIESYGNFVMIDLENEDSAKQITQQLLNKGIFVRQLNAFGLAHCIRISTGSEEENSYFINNFK